MLRIERLRDPGPLTAQIADVYRSAFSIFADGPAEDEVRTFSEETLPRHAAREAFRFFAAFDDDVLVGFIYGYHGHDGEWWEDWLHARIPQQLYDLWFTDQFDLTEFCVSADRHGRGIGSALYEALLTSLTTELAYPRAVLTTRRGQNPARRFYENRGWEVVWEALDDRFSLLGLRLR
jgi:ribosomal protein S18 acetylase RimI-like enzyme